MYPLYEGDKAKQKQICEYIIRMFFLGMHQETKDHYCEKLKCSDMDLHNWGFGNSIPNPEQVLYFAKLFREPIIAYYWLPDHMLNDVAFDLKTGKMIEVESE